MSTTACDEACTSDVKDPYALLCGLESNSVLFQPAQLSQRLLALDDLDAAFGRLDEDDFARCSDSRAQKRAKMLRAELEAANTELYQSLRSDIVRSGRPHRLLQWLAKLAGKDESQIPSSGFGFDCLDDLLNGVFQLAEPSKPDFQLLPEMVFYQPTPVRHILHLIAATALTQDDCFVDLGSGLGHVSLLVSMMTGPQSLGIEVQSPYVVSARECAQSLHLSRVRFVSQDVREADLSSGTVFYLYSPFKGRLLTEVLSALRKESTRRSIKICSFGPITFAIANETWLQTADTPEAGRIAVFASQ